MHETGREADRGRPGSSAPKSRSPTPVFRGFTSLRRPHRPGAGQVFRRNPRRLDKSSSPSMRAPVGSGGSIRQVRSAIQEVMENGPRPQRCCGRDRPSAVRPRGREAGPAGSLFGQTQHRARGKAPVIGTGALPFLPSMTPGGRPDRALRCSFCGMSQKQVRTHVGSFAGALSSES
jgi:hypothetical protein